MSAVLRLLPPRRAGAFPAGHDEDPGHRSPRPVRHRDAYLHPTAFLGRAVPPAQPDHRVSDLPHGRPPKRAVKHPVRGIVPVPVQYGPCELYVSDPSFSDPEHCPEIQRRRPRQHLPRPTRNTPTTPLGHPTEPPPRLAPYDGRPAPGEPAPPHPYGGRPATGRPAPACPARRESRKRRGAGCRGCGAARRLRRQQPTARSTPLANTTRDGLAAPPAPPTPPTNQSRARRALNPAPGHPAPSPTPWPTLRRSHPARPRPTPSKPETPQP